MRTKINVSRLTTRQLIRVIGCPYPWAGRGLHPIHRLIEDFVGWLIFRQRAINVLVSRLRRMDHFARHEMLIRFYRCTGALAVAVAWNYLNYRLDPTVQLEFEFAA